MEQMQPTQKNAGLFRSFNFMSNHSGAATLAKSTDLRLLLHLQSPPDANCSLLYIERCCQAQHPTLRIVIIDSSFTQSQESLDFILIRETANT